MIIFVIIINHLRDGAASVGCSFFVIIDFLVLPSLGKHFFSVCLLVAPVWYICEQKMAELMVRQFSIQGIC